MSTPDFTARDTRGGLILFHPWTEPARAWCDRYLADWPRHGGTIVLEGEEQLDIIVWALESTGLTVQGEDERKKA